MRVLRAALVISSFVVSAAAVMRRGSRTGRRPLRTLSLIAALAWGLVPARPIAQGQPRRLDENCIVSVLNRNVRVRPDGSWVLPNIPANFGLVRARATCVFDGETVSGESAPFLIAANTSVDVPPIVLGATTPIPQSLTVIGPSDPLTQIGATAPLTVTAIYATGPGRNVT